MLRVQAARRRLSREPKLELPVASVGFPVSLRRYAISPAVAVATTEYHETVLEPRYHPDRTTLSSPSDCCSTVAQTPFADLPAPLYSRDTRPDTRRIQTTTRPCLT